MIKPDSTEATVKKVALETDIEVKEPLKPNEVANYDCPDKDITSQREVFDCILKMSEYDWTVEDYFERNEFKSWEDWDWNVIITDKRGDIVRDIVMDYLMENYNWKYAYLNNNWRELYWRVQVDRYNSICKTPYWRVEMPMLTVWGVPVFFPTKWLLNEEQRYVYEMYNNKTEDFDRMELERRIVWDLIRYSQLGTKTVEDCKAIVDRIVNECKNVWTITKVGFRDFVFRIDFGWRLVTDTDKQYWYRVLPPFTIKIDFVNHTIECEWEHPHNLHPRPCLWGTMTDLRDRCFRDRDLYWLVMGMVEFWNAWTSSDAGNTSREPGCCCINWINDRGFDWVIAILNEWIIKFVDLWDTISDTNGKYFLRHTDRRKSYFLEQLENEELVREMIQRRGEEFMKDIFVSAYSDNEEKKNEMFAKYFTTNQEE